MAFLEDSLSSTVQNSHVMVVGTGGIGCELLKNLVLTGFQKISAVSVHALHIDCLQCMIWLNQLECYCVMLFEGGGCFRYLLVSMGRFSL